MNPYSGILPKLVLITSSLLYNLPFVYHKNTTRLTLLVVVIKRFLITFLSHQNNSNKTNEQVNWIKG